MTVKYFIEIFHKLYPKYDYPINILKIPNRRSPASTDTWYKSLPPLGPRYGGFYLLISNVVARSNKEERSPLEQVLYKQTNHNAKLHAAARPDI